VCEGGNEGNGGVYLLMCVYGGSGAGLSRGLEDWACLFTIVFGCFTGRAGAKHHRVFRDTTVPLPTERKRGREIWRDSAKH